MDENFNQGQFATQQEELPNSVAILVLGIVSIATCWCYGIVGLVTAIIALVLASKAKELYKQNHGAYTEASYKNMNAGKICAIIGAALSAFFMFISIIYFIILAGGTLIQMPDTF